MTPEPVYGPGTDFAEDSMRWHGRILHGAHRHYCYDWDGLPIDETCDEYRVGCTCWPHEERLT